MGGYMKFSGDPLNIIDYVTFRYIYPKDDIKNT